MIKFEGIDKFITDTEDFVKKSEDMVLKAKKDVVTYLLKNLLKNTPVWSGDTAGSYMVSNTGAMSNRKKTHSPAQRGTNTMPLGEKAEQYAPAAWSQSISTASSVTYRLDTDVSITNDSDIWAEVDSGSAPVGHARNPSGVSVPATIATTTAFRFVRK